MISRPGTRGIWLSAVFVLLAAMTAQARPESAARVVLADSTVYTNVEVRYDRIYKTLSIQGGETDRTVSVTLIVAIYDNDGRDITEELLKGDYQPAVSPTPPAEIPSAPPATTLSATGSVATSSDSIGRPFVYTDETPSRRFPFAIMFHGRGDWSIPTGEFYRGMKSGIGFELAATVPVERHLALRGIISRAGMRVDKDVFAPELIGVQVLEDNLRANVWRYLLAFEYYDWPHWRQGGKTMYYLYTGLGAITHSITGRIVFRDPVTQLEGVVTAVGPSVNKFLIETGIGGFHQFARNLGAELEINLGAVAVRADPEAVSFYGSVEYALIIDFRVGLVLML